MSAHAGLPAVGRMCTLAMPTWAAVVGRAEEFVFLFIQNLEIAFLIKF